MPVTRIETISDGIIDWGRVGLVSPEEANSSFLIQKGDILLSHINSVNHIGKVARKEDDKPLLHGMNLMLLRFNQKVDARFGYAVMSSPRTKKYFERRAKKAINQASINKQDIFELPFHFPPKLEQISIADKLDSVDDTIGKTKKTKTEAGQLRDALLHELLTCGISS